MFKINDTLLEPYFIDYSYEYIQWDFDFNGQKIRILINQFGFVEFYTLNEDDTISFGEFYTVCMEVFCNQFKVKGSFTASDYFVEIDGIYEAQEKYPLPEINTVNNA